MAIELPQSAIRTLREWESAVDGVQGVEQFVEAHDPNQELWTGPRIEDRRPLRTILTDGLEEALEDGTLDMFEVEAGPESGYQPYKPSHYEEQEGFVRIVDGLIDPPSGFYVLVSEYESTETDTDLGEALRDEINKAIKHALTRRGLGLNWTYARRVAEGFARTPQSMQERRPVGPNVAHVLLTADDPGTGFTPPEAMVFWDEAEVRFGEGERIRVKEIEILPSGPFTEGWTSFDSFVSPAG